MEPIKEQADGDLKKEQYRKLNLELSKLEKNVQRLNHNVRDALEQAPSFRDMGTYHASIFMGAAPVLNPHNSDTSH